VSKAPALALPLLALGTLVGSGPRDRGYCARRVACEAAAVAEARPDSLHFASFGYVKLYYPPDTGGAGQVVLFVSGDGGWELGVVNMARAIAAAGHLVVGIDIRTYLTHLNRATGSCGYPAADFEALSQYVQQRLGFAVYRPPILVGYSSGATLVYATLAQAPPTTFAGAISLGFCPDLALGRPLCKGSGLESRREPGRRGFMFQPVANRDLRWIALQGTIDQVCSPDSTRAFVSRVAGGELVILPGVGHGFGVTRRWLPQLEAAVARLASEPPVDRAATDVAVRDLPLVETPGRGTARRTFVVMISGDGGWASLDRDVAGVLADSGLAVVGLNALQYFWTRRTPQGTATDVARIIRHYLAAWDKQDVVLAGYSRGAEVLPFVANRLPPELKQRVRLVAMIAPETHTSFKFHPADLLLDVRHRDDVPVVPELERLTGAPVVCFYGEDETDSACRPRDVGPAGTAGSVEETDVGRRLSDVALPGGHHFGGAYRQVAWHILAALR
jgi:type IV secretory pathway VirJ component